MTVFLPAPQTPEKESKFFPFRADPFYFLLDPFQKGAKFILTVVSLLGISIPLKIDLLWSYMAQSTLLRSCQASHLTYSLLLGRLSPFNTVNQYFVQTLSPEIDNCPE